MPGITLTSIKKGFGGTPVLKGIDLDIREGEFLTLVGPSGCGKSTLLRIIAGLEAQDAGQVLLDGRDVTGLRAADRDLAMVFQSYALYPHLSVAENMATPLRMRRLGRMGRLPLVGPMISRGPRRDIAAKVRETAEVLRIEALLDRKPGQLSGGQRQRVALGRAMVRDPAAFLMDEPLSNLDAALRVHMRAELSELHARLGATFVYVTHDQAEALTMSDRMAVMMGGEILQLDTPARIYRDPADLRVATFVGSPQINVLPGEIDSDGRITRAGVPLKRRVSGAPRGPVSVAIRPEHLSVCTPGDSDGLAGRLIYRENLGADTYLHLDLGEDRRLVLRCDAAEAENMAADSLIHARQRRGEALVFDADGKRLRLAEAQHAQAECA